MTSKASVCVALATVASLSASAALVTYDVGDYVQDGLKIHLDGIRNAGAAQPHDPHARTWVNLATGNPGFTFVAPPEIGDVSGGWTPDGFAFVTNVYAKSDARIVFGPSVTLQMASDVGNEVDNRSDDLLYPAFVNCSDHFISLYTRFVDKQQRLEWRSDYFISESFGTDKRCLLPVWNGLNCTAICDGAKRTAWLFSGDSRATCDTGGMQTGRVSRQTSAVLWYVGGNPPDHMRDGMRGLIHAVRFYDRALTDEEVAHNNRIDRFRFRSERAVTNVVVVSSRPGLEGAESGNCEVDGSHVFTAPAALTAPDGGSTWACAGYRLETWSDGTGWGTPDDHANESSYAYTVGTDPAKVRLTWLWRQTSGLVRSEPCDYVQDGLLAQYDAIRNGGGLQPHRDYPVWANSVDRNNPAYIVDIPGPTGSWGEKAYRFRGASFAEMAYGVRPGKHITVEAAAEADMRRQTSVYAYYFGPNDDSFSTFLKWTADKKPYYELKATIASNERSDFFLPQMLQKYLTAGVGADGMALIGDTSWGSQKSVTGKELGSVRLDIAAGDKVTLAQYPAKVCQVSDYHSLRIYNRKLTNDELAYNRVIDEERFYGVLSETNVVVASLAPAEAARRNLGNFRVMGSYDFQPPCTRAEKDGRVYLLDGYRLDTWDATAKDWIPSGRFAASNYLYTVGTDPAKVRLTWLWRRGGGLVTYDADDYVLTDLSVNFDAQRNVGLDAAHDSTAGKWLDCADTLRSISFVKKDGSTAGWSDDRYRTSKTAYGVFSEKVFIPESASVQIVLSDTDLGNTMPFPMYFARPDDSFALYTRTANRKLEWKYFSQQPRAMFENWNGLYLNAVMTASNFYFSQNAARENGVASVAAAADRNLWHTFNIGAEANDLARTYADCSYHAVRIYTHALTDWELVHNRVIDEARYRSVLPVTNVVIAVDDPTRGFAPTEACGPYQVGESYVFTAARQRIDGVSYRVAGYTRETWDSVATAWTNPVFVRSDRYAYETGVSPERVRITWTWTCGLMLFVK